MPSGPLARTHLFDGWGVRLNVLLYAAGAISDALVRWLDPRQVEGGVTSPGGR